MRETTSFFHPEYARELDLLCLIGGTTCDAGSLARADELIARGIDWDFAIKAISYHGIIPCVFANLRKHFANKVPNDHFRRLSSMNDNLMRHNFNMFAEVFRLQDAFETKGIPFVCFKGPLIAARYYKDICLRGFGDVDLIVDRCNLDRAQETLLRRGYTRLPKLVPPQTEAFYRSCRFKNSTSEQSFQLCDTSIVDLHWTVQPRRFISLDTSEVIKSCESVKIQGRMLKTLPRDLDALVLLVHGSKHSWKRLIWACDLREMIQAGAVDWQQVIALAKRHDTTGAVSLGLNIVSELLNVVPPLAVESSSDAKLALLMREAVSALHVLNDSGAGGMAASIRWNLQLREKVQNKLLFLFDELLEPNIFDLNRFRLPSYLHALYYLLHPYSIVEGACLRRWHELHDNRRKVSAQASVQSEECSPQSMS